MPAQGATPNVASTVSAPASVEYLPPSPNHVRKVERLSDMGTGKYARPGQVHIDLHRLADDVRFSELGWKQRDQFRLRHTVDLGAGEYRINGRGRVMRAAVKLARQILKGGKRLPKNLYKELVLSLLEAILDTLPQTAIAEFATPYLATPEGWVFRSYGALNWAQGIPFELAQEAVIGSHPGVGKTKWSNSVYDPSGFGNGPQPAYLAAIGGQAIGNVTPPSALRRGLFVQQNTVPRYQHVASYFRKAGVTTPWPANMARLMSSAAVPIGATLHLSAPFTSTLVERKSVLEKPVRVAVKQKDVKLSAPLWMNGAFNVAMAATETADTIDCLYKALPPWERYGRSYTDKMGRVYSAFESVDWGKAVGCMMFNQVTDKMFVTVKRAIDKPLRAQSINGMSYQYGVTYGGGPTGYLELTW